MVKEYYKVTKDRWQYEYQKLSAMLNILKGFSYRIQEEEVEICLVWEVR